LVIQHCQHVLLWFLISKRAECQIEQRMKVLQHKAGKSADQD